MRHFNILDVSIYQIQLFLAVAEERNFSRAATRMNLTQPALSKRIVSLEEVVGIPLFDRDKRPVELTTAGATLYEKWRDIARQFELAVEEAKDIHERETQKLVVGIIDSSRKMYAFQMAGKQLHTEYPDLAFSWEYITYGHWREKLTAQELDLMFILAMERPTYAPGWKYDPVIVCPKLVCMLKTNPLAAKDAITYEDLRNQRFVVNSPKAMPSHYNFIRENTLKHGGFVPDVVRYASTTHDLIGNLKNDDEVVVCDMFLRDIDSDFIRVFELPDTYSGLDAVWRGDNENPYILRYIELAKQYLTTNYPTIP